MAKRVVKWTLQGNDRFVLGISKALENNDKIVIDFEFDLKKVFPDIEKMTDVQQQVIIFGVKQKLSDTGASEIADYEGKFNGAKAKWNEILEGKWIGERLNKTGASEERKAGKAVKEMARVISLEGLVMKKALSSIPGNPPFTAEDEEKLKEFLAVAAKAGKVGNKH